MIPTFIDSNVLIYAYDMAAEQKSLQAQVILMQLWEQNTGLISSQVLQEFYVNVTRKIKMPLSLPQARDIVLSYQSWPFFAPSAEDVAAASQLEQRYQLSFWDALIVLAAQRSGAEVLLSEDLQDGQRLGDVTVKNPFV